MAHDGGRIDHGTVSSTPSGHPLSGSLRAKENEHPPGFRMVARQRLGRGGLCLDVVDASSSRGRGRSPNLDNVMHKLLDDVFATSLSKFDIHNALDKLLNNALDKLLEMLLHAASSIFPFCRSSLYSLGEELERQTLIYKHLVAGVPVPPDLPISIPCGLDSRMERPYDELEKKLQDPNETPMSFPLEFLKAITCDFSTESILGEGGFGAVYKGVLTCGKIIAVKKLFEVHLNEETFQNEVCYHMGIKHPNVVRFLGCCAESSWHPIELPSGSGKYILAEAPQRFLCFEYVCNKSLNKHISDESLGLEWNMRYEIIKGICNGLHFLHEECRMVHLDLKPENILMDSSMMPKIADFGLSRILGERQSRTVTNNKVGTRGYMAPEYLNRGVVSYKADIFSLGVIVLEIITGGRDYPYFQQDIPHCADPSFQQFTEKVLGSWRNKFGSTPKYKTVEKYIQQVEKCVTIALKCVDPGTEERPPVKNIIEVLNAADQIGPSPALSKAEEPFWSAQSTISAKPSSTTPASVPIRYKAASSQGDPYGASQEDNSSS